MDPLQRSGLADTAAEQLRQDILEGRLDPGTKLSEIELSRRLEISRAPVHEALLRLEQEGLVTSSRYRGTQVVRLSEQDVDELATLRSSLERLAWSRACTTVTEQDLADLEQIIGRMRAAISSQDHSQLVLLDIEFHDRVFRAARHGRLHAAWSTIKWQIALFLLHRRVVVNDYHQILVGEHAELLEVLRARDAARADVAIREHIGTAYARLAATFDGPDAGQLTTATTPVSDVETV